jgi:hypothetical protein
MQQRGVNIRGRQMLCEHLGASIVHRLTPFFR